jgi:hypothetical protein
MRSLILVRFIETLRSKVPASSLVREFSSSYIRINYRPMTVCRYSTVRSVNVCDNDMQFCPIPTAMGKVFSSGNEWRILKCKPSIPVLKLTPPAWSMRF